VKNVTDNGRRVEVTYIDPARNVERMEEFDAAVIATTAKPALEMYPQMDENHRQLYSTARYRGMVASMVGLNRAPTDTLTYVLVPTIEDPHYLAVISDHNKTSGHVPTGKSLYTLNSTHEHLMATMDWSESRMRDDAIACVKRYHGGDVEGTIDQFRLNRWPAVVPVLDAGRFREINRFQKALSSNGRVQFASDLDRIPGVNGALVSGWDAAKRLLAGAAHR
jgi:protoporphyrinogen oxidase